MNIMTFAAALALLLAPAPVASTATDTSTRADAIRLTAELGVHEIGRGRVVYTHRPERRTLTARVAVRLEIREVRLVVGGVGYDIALNEEGVGALELTAAGGEGMPTLRAGDTVEVMANGRLLMAGELARG